LTSGEKSHSTIIVGCCRIWKPIIVTEEPEDITAVDDEMYKKMSAEYRKDELTRAHARNRK
jgi:hypothetical protein